MMRNVNEQRVILEYDDKLEKLKEVILSGGMLVLSIYTTHNILKILI